MNLSSASAFFMFALGLWSAWGWHQDNDRMSRGHMQSTRAEERSVPFVPTNGSAWAPRGRKIVAAPTDTCTEATGLISRIAAEYDAPAGMLYGIWKKESSGLCGGHGNAHPWKVPTELMVNGGCVAGFMQDDYARCAKNPSARKCSKEELRKSALIAQEKCERNFAALKAVCSQVRDTPNGPQRVCDPSTIRTSWAFAMGATQVMPTTLFRLQDGVHVRTDHAVDYDGDGVVDPHALPDALASAAKLLKHKYAYAAVKKPGMSAHALWEFAANLYFGELDGTYYSGTGDKRGVRSYWTEWCELTGACNTSRVAYAAR